MNSPKAGSDAIQKFKQALLALPGVEDCHIMPRKTQDGGEQSVAYLLLSQPFNQEQAHAGLQDQFPEEQLPCAYIPVTALPLTGQGGVDEDALSQIPVIDEELRDQYEQTLQQQPGIKQAAVLIQEPDQIEHIPPLHLADILPDWNKAAAEAEKPDTAGAAEEKEAEKTGMAAVWALSDGGPLIIPEDAPKTLTDALVQTAADYPDKGITYIQPDGAKLFQSYADLLEEAKCILSGLRHAGLHSGDQVILQIRNTRDHFAAFWACALEGIISVTVAIAPTYEERNGIIDKLFGTWDLLKHPPILANTDLLESLSELKRFMPMESLEVLSVNEMRKQPPAENIPPRQPEDVIFYQLSSGSTGVPKCIQEIHQAIIAHIHSTQQFNGYQTDDTSLNWLAVDHVAPLLMYHIKRTYLGCNQVQVPVAIILGNPLKWLDYIEEFRVTHTWAPNFGYKLVTDALAGVQNKTWDLSSLQLMMNGGEQVTLPTIRNFLKAVAPFGVAPQVMQPAFGMAETCTGMTYENNFSLETSVRWCKNSSLGGKLIEAEADDADSVIFMVLGRAIPGIQMRIVGQDNQLLPEGVIGRLHIKGPVVSPGYYRNEAANRETFLADGWYNSGDLGFILNGGLCITGREKELIIINGTHFHCYDIEDTVNQIEGVEPTYSAACEMNDPHTGSEGLAIFFAPVEEGLRNNIELIKNIRARVTSTLGLSPARIIPLTKKNFPKTTSGKIQRTQMKKGLAAGNYDDILRELDILLENPHTTLPDWFYKKIWRLAQAQGQNIAMGACVVFMDDQGLGDQLCALLEGQNRSCIKVDAGFAFIPVAPDRYRITPKDASHYLRLFQALEEQHIQYDTIVHLWTYGRYNGEVDTPEALEQAQEKGVCSLLSLVQAAAQVNKEEHPLRLYMVSSNTQSVFADEPNAYEKSPALALIKTISQEIPWLSAHHLDMPLDKPESNAEFVRQELQAFSTEREVAYRREQRGAPRLQKADLAAGPVRPAPFKRGGIYLVSGGLGGIGMEIAKYLLQTWQAKVL
ncbi:MAG: AMP-binding protein, partial [Gammaproteobacteria bacterium]|nr:AMP-binding protein [Gammaproteobacteria bacterium]